MSVDPEEEWPITGGGGEDHSEGAFFAREGRLYVTLNGQLLEVMTVPAELHEPVSQTRDVDDEDAPTFWEHLQDE